jgi:hypothetical protein
MSRLRVRDLSDSAYSGAGGQANGGSADTDRHDDLLRLLNIGSDNAGSGGDASSGMAGVFGCALIVAAWILVAMMLIWFAVVASVFARRPHPVTRTRVSAARRTAAPSPAPAAR